MIKKRILSTLTIFLLIFISVTFLIPSDLVAETRKFRVEDGHYDEQKVWVESGHFQDTWVDTSHNVLVASGYFQDTQEKRWVDTSHMVYQGYLKNVSKSFWVDTSKWVSSGYWKYVTEKVWVTSGYIAYRDVKKWVDTSHWETRYSKVWVVCGEWVYKTVKNWIDTSHWVTKFKNVWATSGYWAYKTVKNWVNTSHWVRQAYRVYVSSGHWLYKTVKNWIDTSHWTTVSYKVWVVSGHWGTVRESYWVNTSHWEDQKVGVAGHWETRYREVEDWQPCDKTFVDQLLPSEPKNVILSKWDNSDKTVYEGMINGTMYRYYMSYYLVLPGNNLFVPDLWPDDLWVIFKIKYICFEVLNWVKEAYGVWVPPDWKKEWVDTSHLVKSGYWRSYNYNVWVDTSYLKSEGYWEYYTQKTWVDTSHNVWVIDGHTQRTWVDTSDYETRDVWVDTSYWVEAELDPEGKVLHTEKWNENRVNYNLSETGDPDKPRGYEIFFNGEKFVLEADTPGDFQPESVHVEFLGTVFETDLTKTEDSKWEGFIWDESFIYFHDRECVFKFTASYDYNGEKFKIEDEVTVYIVRDYYWQLHRLF